MYRVVEVATERGAIARLLAKHGAAQLRGREWDALPPAGTHRRPRTGAREQQRGSPRALHLDPSSWQAVVFDPRSMTILDTRDLGGLHHPTPGYFAWAASAERGSELVAVAYYLDWQAETVEALCSQRRVRAAAGS